MKVIRLRDRHPKRIDDMVQWYAQSKSCKGEERQSFARDALRERAIVPCNRYLLY